MFRTAFVVNSAAGSGRINREWPALAELIRKKILQSHIEFTRGPQDATVLTSKLIREGFELIVAVGGDGTINECVNGFFENGKLINPQAALGVLPYGRGSDLARFLKIPKDAEAALDYLIGANFIRLDVGLGTFVAKSGEKASRYFINIANVGLVSCVVDSSHSTPKFLGSQISYLYGALLGALKYKAVPVVYSCDGKKKEIRLLNMILANGAYFGSGMKAAPHAKIDDGLLDVVVASKMPILTFLRRIPGLYSGNHLKIPEVDFFREKIVDVSPVNSKDKIPVEMDGDTVGYLPAQFKILPGALKFKV